MTTYPQDIISKEATQLHFAAVVEEYKDMVFNIVLGIVQQQEEAEDITQDVFVTLHQKWEQFKGAASRRTWIYKIAVNAALDSLRAAKTQKRGGLLRRVFGGGEDEKADHFYHPGVQLDEKENAAVLFSALGKIPEKQRVAFLLQQLEGQAVQEIGDILGTSKMAAESLIKRAKENLRNILST